MWAGKDNEETVWKGCDVFYRIEDTNKAIRIENAIALELISNEKAVLQVDYDSIGKIEFILTDDSFVKAFLFNKKGDRRKIALKDALKIIADGMARIHDIKIE